MKFIDRVTTLTEKPPKGWRDRLWPDEYEKLPDVRKRYYRAVFARYRVKKSREYDEYGHFIGWEPYKVGVGKPIGYEYMGYIAAAAVDGVLKSNVIMSRILGQGNMSDFQPRRGYCPRGCGEVAMPHTHIEAGV